MFKRLAAACALAMTLAASASASSIAFDNLDASGLGGLLVDDRFKQALIFDAEASGALVSVTADFRDDALTLPGEIQFSLYSDGVTAPGTLIDKSDAFTVTASALTRLKVLGWDSATLVAGTRYWLVAEALTGGAVWDLSNISGSEDRYFFRDGTWRAASSTTGAARLTVAAVPLPAGALLLLTGFGGLALLRRR